MIRPILFALMFSGSAAFSGGQIAKGERTFKKCKTCHMIRFGEQSIFRGGKSGPNLFGIIGRQAGTMPGFNYGKSLMAAGDAGLIWDQELLARYVTDPQAFIKEYLADSRAHSYMSFRLKKGGNNVAAYLASVAPKPGTEQYQTYLELTARKPVEKSFFGKIWDWF